MVYFSSPESRCSHHSNSMEWHISLNHGVNFRLGSSNRPFNSAGATYCVSRTSFLLTSRSTLALMNRI